MANQSPIGKSFAIVVAVCHENGMGIEGRLPWRLKREMSFFTRITSSSADGKQNAVIMGRNTWQSIPPQFRPLPNRVNAVLSKSLSEKPNGSHYLFGSLNEAIEKLSEVKTIDKLFLIGGQEAYREAVTRTDCQLVYLTRIDAHFKTDVFFPELDFNQFQDISREDNDIPDEEQEENGLKYQYFLYKRKALQN